MNDPIYLDHNATTPVLPEVVAAMLPFLGAQFGNPSSAHVYGQRARQGVERARAEVAALLGCSPEEVVFTSGGTEANNLAIRGSTAASARRGIVTSTIEHPATEEPVAWLERAGWRAARVGVDAVGRVERGALEEAITGATALVSIMHSNNETGVLQPIEAAVRRAREVESLVHVDAAQSVGKVPLDVHALDVDLLSVAGHKLYAPKGVGALYVRRGVSLEPLVRGAAHERGLRPGTENVAAIVGLGAACAVARCDLLAESARVRRLRDELFALLEKRVPALALNGDPERRLPNTLNVGFPRATGSAVLAAAPEVAASTGSACHAGAESASPVLLAMGIAPDAALGSVRLTLGRGTTQADVARAAECLARAWHGVAAGASA
jgi:cysteine desulfurase